eukprot:TRINITY_DN19254_c0_g1_i1.p1 TRINITY_DN19254_c0_g1~~TRINITY_DN19254_c0_g1_i1.p1  ORF type:complete len:605 (+),score=74.65 TRINITY_DN19254_c0_g1_i1:264-2078(+)
MTGDDACIGGGIGDMSADPLESETSRVKSGSSSRRLNRRAISKLGFEGDSNSVFVTILMHPVFDTGAMVIICLNAAWIGIEVDMVDELPAVVFAVVGNIFCILFCFDIFVRVCAHSPKYRFFTQPTVRAGNIFDFLLVAMMVTETWVFGHLIVITNKKTLEIVSLLRLFRLMRMTRLFRMIPELGLQVKSMIAAVRSVSSTCVMAFAIMYVFALGLTEWVREFGPEGKCIQVVDGGHPVSEVCDRETDECICLQDYFGGMLESLLTLFQVLVFDDTFELVRPVLFTSWWYGCVMLGYIVFVGFTVMNMLIGLICDVICEISEADKMKLLEADVADIFLACDVDANGLVSRDELNNVVERLGRLGISKSVLTYSFNVVDTNGDGVLDLTEFNDVIFKCLHPILSQDLHWIETKIERLARELKSVDDEMNPSRSADEMRAVLQRLKELGSQLEKLQMKVDTSGGGIDHSPVGVAADLEVPVVPIDGAKTTQGSMRQRDLGTVGTHLKLLSAQLHGLRAEFKAAELHNAGGPVDRSVLSGAFANRPPLDVEISQVLEMIFDTRQVLYGRFSSVSTGSGLGSSIEQCKEKVEEGVEPTMPLSANHTTR